MVRYSFSFVKAYLNKNIVRNFCAYGTKEKIQTKCFPLRAQLHY